MDRPEGDDSGARWLSRAGRWVAVLAVIGLVVPMLFALFASRSGGSAQPARQAPPRVSATVTEVIDGNTIRVDIAGRSELVRYIGAQTPPVGEPLHDLAAEINGRWIAGKQVQLEADTVDRDGRGQLLRYVWVDEAMINAALIAAGLARNDGSAENSRYAAPFLEIERNARSNGFGIWAADDRGA